MIAAMIGRRRCAVAMGLGALALVVGGVPLRGQDGPRGLKPVQVEKKRALLIGNAAYVGASKAEEYDCGRAGAGRGVDRSGVRLGDEKREPDAAGDGGDDAGIRGAAGRGRKCPPFVASPLIAYWLAARFLPSPDPLCE